jgi:hypothetical protein
MKGAEAVIKLSNLGYRFRLEGDRVIYEYTGLNDPDPAQVRPLLEKIKAHKDEVCGLLRVKRPSPPERILTCAECPWHEENPWTNYPELPFWCAWHFDHLLADNPACIGYRRGEIPPRDNP